MTSQYVCWAAWRASGGTNTLSEGDMYEAELDDKFFDWLRRSDGNWTITATADDDSIVISHWNQVEIETMRTTIVCDRSDYDKVVNKLKVLRATFQQRERERAAQ